jgi:hypothetical protein
MVSRTRKGGSSHYSNSNSMGSKVGGRRRRGASRRRRGGGEVASSASGNEVASSASGNEVASSASANGLTLAQTPNGVASADKGESTDAYVTDNEGTMAADDFTSTGGRRRRKRGGDSSSADDSPTNQVPTPIGGRKSRRRGRHGGASAIVPGAYNWLTSNFGSSAEQQFMNTFGNSGNGHSGNLIPTLTGAPGVTPYNVPQGSVATYVPNPAQSGGKRRKKGGYWAQVLQQALVPFGLLGLQQAYGRRTRKHHK